MLIDDFRERLGTRIKADVELLLADFRASVATEDPDAFVGCLYKCSC